MYIRTFNFGRRRPTPLWLSAWGVTSGWPVRGWARWRSLEARWEPSRSARTPATRPPQHVTRTRTRRPCPRNRWAWLEPGSLDQGIDVPYSSWDWCIPTVHCIYCPGITQCNVRSCSCTHGRTLAPSSSSPCAPVSNTIVHIWSPNPRLLASGSCCT